MKRLTLSLRHMVLILSAACIMAQTTGCAKADQASHGATKPDMIEAIAQEKEAAAQSSEASSETGFPEPVVTAPELTAPAITDDAHLPSLPESDVDVDLTKMSGTVVYARVLNLLTHPENYVGMTVRMNGAFSLYINEETDAHYYACIIKDATACCAQGIEFVRKGNYSYPEDYPEDGAEIVVEGVFEIYEEEGFRYIHLVDADMQLADETTAVSG
ncbi:MAG: hypothetical protein IJQ21_04740 [Lachnospiraceae bacterium]|nr:hypothetical protein [Lachnospiraceae bacterium]